MTEKEKIRKYLDYKGVSKNKFYLATGLSMGFLDSGKSLGVDKLKIIISIYPDLSLDWLILDRGPMIREVTPTEPAANQRDQRDIIIASLEKTIAAHEKTIARDDQLIAALQQQISDLGGGHISHTKKSGSVPSVDVLLSASREKNPR